MQAAPALLAPILAGAGTKAAGFSLGTALTVASAGASIAQGVMAFQSSRQQAAQIERQAEVEQLRNREKAAEIRADMRRRIGQQNAMLAGRGIAPGSFGIGSSITSQTRRDAEADLSSNAANAAASRDTLRAQADQERMAGTAGLLSGFVDAGTTLAGTFATRRSIGAGTVKKPRGKKV